MLTENDIFIKQRIDGAKLALAENLGKPAFEIEVRTGSKLVFLIFLRKQSFPGMKCKIVQYNFM